MTVVIKRAYEEAKKEDGVRILVDRIWPRGRSKEALQADHWMKELAPSPGLRKWFGHDPAKFEEFIEKYKEELADNKEALDELKKIIKEEEKVTLVYAAKDEERNQAAVLKKLLAEGI
ncbi:DUF488 family protein [Metabacillus sp. GX 13764]|uniref:DUF488 domain-containing protein n=1 Tax=Metabacillus kandeliae TaxID=2900151 RepID=UPI001E62BC55|nr:DUF488 family protein [Metabacillus kandeliae]MCD7034099.1 DUF488 family protein [Metabacillus kandeliae]